VDRTLNEFREKPAKVGRARIFGERTIGMDDPGMVALRVMVNALA
jgi:phosphoenolpyruvate---glycerone phosphotransferase subunit DhaL